MFLVFHAHCLTGPTEDRREQLVSGRAGPCGCFVGALPCPGQFCVWQWHQSRHTGSRQCLLHLWAHQLQPVRAGRPSQQKSRGKWLPTFCFTFYTRDLCGNCSVNCSLIAPVYGSIQHTKNCMGTGVFVLERAGVSSGEDEEAARGPRGRGGHRGRNGHPLWERKERVSSCGVIRYHNRHRHSVGAT